MKRLMEKTYEPTWNSLKEKTTPKWFRDAKFGKEAVYKKIRNWSRTTDLIERIKHGRKPTRL
jgi:hypothetical protein